MERHNVTAAKTQWQLPFEDAANTSQRRRRIWLDNRYVTFLALFGPANEREKYSGYFFPPADGESHTIDIFYVNLDAKMKVAGGKSTNTGLVLLQWPAVIKDPRNVDDRVLPHELGPWMGE